MAELQKGNRRRRRRRGKKGKRKKRPEAKEERLGVDQVSTYFLASLPGTKRPSAQIAPAARPGLQEGEKPSQSPPHRTDCSSAYLYLIPGCFKLVSLLFEALCTDSCPRLRATIATARKRPRVPGLGLLAAERPSRSSGPRLLRLCSEHTKDTCMLSAGSAPDGFRCHQPLRSPPLCFR